MVLMLRIIALVLASVFSVFWLSCTAVQPTASGGTGSETVLGKVLTPAGVPAQNATVYLRRTDYVSTLDMTQHPRTADYANVLTDDSGCFSIAGIATGSYRIEINDRGLNAHLFTCSIDGSTDVLDLGIGMLKPYAVVRGMVTPAVGSGKTFLIKVRGLERSATVGVDGTFGLTDLPQGLFDLVVTETGSSLVSAEMGGIKTTAGTIAVVALNSRWHYAKRLYLNTTATGANVAQNVMNFPLLVRLDSTNFDFGLVADSGRDLRFAKSDGTLLAHEIEEFSMPGKSAVVWVAIDTVFGNSSDQSITILYGNTDALIPSNLAAVFDTANGFAGVWHLAEPTAQNRADATQNRHTGTTINYEGDESRRGIIGAGDSLDNKDDAVNVGALPLTTALSMSLWINTAAYIPWAHLIAKSSGKATKPWLIYGLQLDSAAMPHISITITTDQGDSSIETSSTVPLHTWCHVAGTYDGSRVKLYFNGSLETDVPFSGTIIQNSSDVYLGKLETSPNDRFNGLIDEVRISRIAQNADWVKLCYESQRQNSTFVLYVP